MKEHFERNRERLSDVEQRSLWDAIRADTTSRPPHRSNAWRPLWFFAPAAAAAALVILLVARQGLERRPMAPPAREKVAEEIEPPAQDRISQNEPPAAGAERQAAVTSPATGSVSAEGLASAERSLQAPEPAAAPLPGQAAKRDVSAGARVAAENGTIHGIVRNAKTGGPLAYANVTLVGTAWGCTTDDQGRFSIPNVPAGTYQIRVQFIGYAAVSDTVTVSGESGRDLAIALAENEAPMMAEVEVQGEKSLLQKDDSQSRQTVETKTFESASASSLQDAVARKAGIVAQAGQLHFRGGRAGEVLYRGIRGQPAPGGEWGSIKQMYAPGAEPPVYPSTGGSTEPNDRPYDSMFFQHYGVNPFIATEDDALSTFALDVDQASYTIARRYIELGHLPEPDAPRVEEFVNFFRQDYPPVEDDFGIFLEGAPSPFGRGYELLRMGIKARDVFPDERPRANLVFVIDVSGSMSREDRLELVKRALALLVDELRRDDRVGIVVYGSNGRVLLDPSTLRDRERILDAISRLQPDGSTNAEEGLLLGYEMASRIYHDGEINRIILCSDGVANVGLTGPESILARVRDEADRGIYLTTVGFGMGNYNDVLMEQLANKGDGNYYYVDDLDEARRVFVENLTGTLQTVARDAKVQVEFDPERVDRYRLLGFENRDIADRDFRNDAVDAGEIGAGHEVTALYEVKLARGVSRGTIATVRMRYTPPGHEEEGAQRAREIARPFDAGAIARAFEDASPRFRLDATAAEFAEILRHSYWAKESRIEDLIPYARRVARDLRGDESVSEFARLVEKAAGLTDNLSPEERERPWTAEDVPAPDFDMPFILGPGESAEIGSGRVTVGYDRLLSDNRCPPNVRCVTAGEARVALWIETDRGVQRFELSTWKPRSATIAGYEVELRDVWPKPRASVRPVDESETLIELIVRR